MNEAKFSRLKPILSNIYISFIAILLSLVVASIIMLLVGYNPVAA